MTDRLRTFARRMVPGLALGVCCVLSGCGGKGVSVDSDPPGATVWVDGEIWGRAPVVVPKPVAGPASVRVALPSWEDAIVELTPGSLPADNTLTVKLRRPGTLIMACQSVPSGALVFVDGEVRGETPLEIDGLEPRQVEVVFRMKDRQQVTETVDLTTASGRVDVSVSLPSLTAEYYRQRIKNEPTTIHHYADLAHHYMLEHRLEDAMDVFRQAIEVVFANPGVADSARLWSEIHRVTEKQYDYGDADEVERARRLLRECLAELYRKYPDNRQPMFYTNYIYILDAVNERQKAQEVFEDAWRKFPNERVLRQLRRKGFAPP